MHSDFSSDQKAQLAKIGQAFDSQLRSAKQSIQSVTDILTIQQKQINKSLEPTRKVLEAVKAHQASLPDFSLVLKAMEQAKRNTVIQIDISTPVCKKSDNKDVCPEPQVRRIPPELTSEEITFMKDFIRNKKDLSIPLIAEEVTSLFNRDTFDLHIEGKRIKLEPTEKLICICFFRNPKTRCMLLDTIEEFTYGSIIPDSKRLKQAIKRINSKIRMAGVDSIFSYKEGFLNINI